MHGCGCSCLHQLREVLGRVHERLRLSQIRALAGGVGGATLHRGKRKYFSVSLSMVDRSERCPWHSAQECSPRRCGGARSQSMCRNGGAKSCALDATVQPRHNAQSPAPIRFARRLHLHAIASGPRVTCVPKRKRALQRRCELNAHILLILPWLGVHKVPTCGRLHNCASPAWPLLAP